ncbi:unnamed protein product [Durusdinium trenchii]|uniref:Uncharacterized protein n=1 Tax=Durusdinium trenchii TaxID=1381693 RepID=A0ABP0RGM5_9DINO
MSSLSGVTEDPGALIRRVATNLGFAARDAENFSFSLQKYSTCESLARITDDEAFELSLPLVLVRAVRHEVRGMRFEKPVMRCVVQPPLHEVPDAEVCSDTSSRPTEICHCPPGSEAAHAIQGSSTPQSQVTISPRSLCEDHIQVTQGQVSEKCERPERRYSGKAEVRSAQAGNQGPPLQVRAASLEVPPASCGKVACRGSRLPSTGSTTFPSNTSTTTTTSSSSSAVTGGTHARRIVTAITRVTPRPRVGREEAKKPAQSSPRSIITVRTSQGNNPVRPQGGSLYVPPPRRTSDGHNPEAWPGRTTSPRRSEKPDPDSGTPASALVPARNLRQEMPWPKPSGPASAACPVGRIRRTGRLESPDRRAPCSGRRLGASREDTRVVSPPTQTPPKKTCEEEPVAPQKSPAMMARQGSSVALGMAGALNMSPSNHALFLENSPGDRHNSWQPTPQNSCSGYQLVYRPDVPLSARLPHAARASSMELPPGQNHGVVPPGVIVRPKALPTGFAPGLLWNIQVSRPVRPMYPGAKSWQPRA